MAIILLSTRYACPICGNSAEGLHLAAKFGMSKMELEGRQARLQVLCRLCGCRAHQSAPLICQIHHAIGARASPWRATSGYRTTRTSSSEGPSWSSGTTSAPRHSAQPPCVHELGSVEWCDITSSGPWPTRASPALELSAGRNLAFPVGGCMVTRRWAESTCTADAQASAVLVPAAKRSLQEPVQGSRQPV
jgi:hypothetical protein